jgi:hypothetical protein
MNKRILCCVALIAASGLMLGACGKKSDKERQGQTTVKIGDMEVSGTTQQAGETVPLPPNMPSYAAIYPGGEVKAVVTMGGQPVTGTMISYTTSASPEELIAFYKKNAEAASLQNVNEIRMSTAWHFSAQKPDNEHAITVTISQENGKQSVQQVYN